MSRGILLLFISIVLWSCGDDEVAPNPMPVDTLTEEEEAMIATIDALSLPTPQQPLSATDGDMQWLDALGETGVIGLGEATHGTKEFFQMKDRIFRYLVEKHGFRAYGFEADFAESMFIDNYLQSGVGNLELIMDNRMHFWTWRTEEVHALLQWMREYNEGQVDGFPVRYFGYDCQQMTWQQVLLEIYFYDIDPGFIQDVKRVFAPIVQANEETYSGISDREFDSWQDSLDMLLEYYDAHRPEWEMLVGVTDHYGIEMHRQLIVSMKQVLQVQYAYSNNDNSVNWRDKYMAENVLWYRNLIGAEKKMCVWAHNAHVARDPAYGASGSMGQELMRELGDAYAVVGFGFSRGRFTAVTQFGGQFQGLDEQSITKDPRRSSFNFLFDRTASEAFIIDLGILPDDPDWEYYLRTNHPFLQIGSVFSGNPENYYRELDIDRFYDWIVYYKGTAAAEQL